MNDVITISVVKRLQGYLTDKHHLPDATTAIWDSAALQRAMGSLPNQKRVWMAKWVSGHYGHSRAMWRWGQRTTENCPRCGKPEHPRHLLECAAPSAARIWTDELASLSDWMETQGTSLDIRQSILTGVNHWRSPLWHPAPDSSDRNPAARAVHQQNQIGWQGLFLGRMAEQWEAMQGEYWTKRKRRKSSKKWAATLSRRIWEIPWKLWADRNDTLHKQEEGEHHRLQSEVVDRYIREAFRQGKNGLPLLEQAMFRRGLKSVLNQPIATKEAWMRSIQAASGR